MHSAAAVFPCPHHAALLLLFQQELRFATRTVVQDVVRKKIAVDAKHVFA